MVQKVGIKAMDMVKVVDTMGQIMMVRPKSIFVLFLHKNHFKVEFQLIARANHTTINIYLYCFLSLPSLFIDLSFSNSILGYAGYADYYSGGYGPSGYGAGYQDYYSGNYGKPHYKSNNYHYNNHQHQ